MITKEDIEYLRQLCSAGSPVPWDADIDDPLTDTEFWTGKWYTGDGIWEPGWNDTISRAQEAHNARLTAAARNWLPRLLDEIERQQANTEAARAAIKRRRCR